jgi:hypothetical protein
MPSEPVMFRYDPILVPVEQSFLSSPEVFALMFPEQNQWLLDNEIEFHVQGFRWPEMMTPRSLGMGVVFEFDVIIGNDPQAVMFRIFSGVRVTHES